jgi:hypothetical protein
LTINEVPAAMSDYLANEAMRIIETHERYLLGATGLFKTQETARMKNCKG